MYRKLLAIAVLMAAVTSVQAAEPLERGGYFGAGVGASAFDDDGAFSSFDQNDTDMALMLFGGYKFLKYLAIEGRYSDFGTFDFAGLKIDASALSVHAVGIVPFGNSGWEIYGQLGVGTVKFENQFFGDEDQDAVAGGFGVRFSPTKNFAIGVQTDVFVWEDDSLGPTYDLSVGGTVLSVVAIF